MAKEQTSKTTIIQQSFAPTFGRYETLRILVPGFYFALALLFFSWTFVYQLAPFHLAGLPLFLLFLGVTLVAGLSMYAKETPKRRQAFLQNQPSQYLSAKARTMKEFSLLDDEEARRLYFFILNNYIPPSFHEKIFFFGTVYHVMVQVRRTSFWFALAGTAGIFLQSTAGMLLSEQQGSVVYTVVVWIIYVLNIRYNKADRKMQENYQDQIFWMQMNNPLIESILKRRQSNPPPA